MNLLLYLFITLGPQLPAVVHAQADPLPTETITLQWHSDDARVVGWVLFYGQDHTAQIQPVGSATEAIVLNLPQEHHWFAVGGYDSSGVLVAKSEVLTVTLPPDRVIQYFAKDFDGNVFWSQSFTNTPPGEKGQAGAYYRSWNVYRP